MSNLLVNFAKAVDPAVKQVFNGDFKKAEKQSDKICYSQKAEDYITEIGSNVNLTMAEIRTEQSSVNYEDFLAGNSKNLTQYVYDKGIKISKKLMKWQKLGQIKSLVEGAAQSLVRRKEFDITKLLEQGFNTTYTHAQDGSTAIDLAGGDAVALFSPSHATKRTSTAQSNRITDGTTVNMALSEAALEANETVTFAAITDNSDQVISGAPDTLFVSRKSYWTAQRLIKTQKGRVGTPNNDVNLLLGRYDLVRLDYMSTAYAAYYFTKDSELNKKVGFLTMLIGADGEHDGPYIDFDTKAIKHSWELEFAAGHNNWQSYTGSKGTNAA
ncbi:MAG: hypothetical protein WCW93_03765 [Candidatus Paceibacterota bacterium]|jgi:hypothetical protein